MSGALLLSALLSRLSSGDPRCPDFSAESGFRDGFRDGRGDLSLMISSFLVFVSKKCILPSSRPYLAGPSIANSR
jgi:hypothetical protein